MQGFYFLGIIIASIIGYLLGSISWSIIIVRLKTGLDVRKTGSGNAGSTNVTRLLGKGWGFVVTLLDISKVVLTALIAVALSAIPNSLFSQTSYYIPCFLVLIGHCYPIYYKFKGGKAVSCFIGLLLVINWLYLIIFLISWFTVGFITRKVSMASIFGALTVGVAVWLPWLHGITDVAGFYSYEHLWNAYELFEEPWSNGLYFSLFNAMHYGINQTDYMMQFFANNSNVVPFASGMLETQVIIFLSFGLLAFRHFPNMRRLKKGIEPISIPKYTQEEKIIRKQEINKNTRLKQTNKQQSKKESDK